MSLNSEYLGEFEVKNISEPLRIYKILLETDEGKTLNVIESDTPELPDKPSIAVLPFVNMSGDPSQEYFCDGLTEQIINGLSKVPNLFVIARNSTFVYKGKSIKVQQVSKDLGVKYVLDGGVQRTGKRVRITAQLIDTKTGYHLWSENYDREIEDIFKLQDEVTRKLIDTMHIKLTFGVQARLWSGLPTNIQAYDRLSQGLHYFQRHNEKDNRQAQHFFKEAIKIEETAAFSYAMLAFTHLNDLVFRWSKSPLQSFDKAEKNTEKALALNDSLDMAHIVSGWIYLFKRLYNEAIKEGERAIELNPNGAQAHAHFAYILIFSDKVEAAIKLIKWAFRLEPIAPPYFYHVLSTAYRINEQYEKAIEVAKKGLIDNPDQVTAYLTLAASYSSLNQTDKAHRAAEEVLRIDPSFSLDYFAKVLPIKNQENLNKFIEALCKAGLPE
jgi:adenylate cyclase